MEGRGAEVLAASLFVTFFIPKAVFSLCRVRECLTGQLQEDAEVREGGSERGRRLENVWGVRETTRERERGGGY